MCIAVQKFEPNLENQIGFCVRSPPFLVEIEEAKCETDSVTALSASAIEFGVLHPYVIGVGFGFLYLNLNHPFF